MTSEESMNPTTDGASTADSPTSSGQTPASATSDDSGAETAVLRAENLSHAYGAVTVFEDISVTVERGTVTALVGPNGSGKTTLLRILAGLLEPTEGTVSGRESESARELGYLPQQPSFRPGFTARETLAFYTSLVGGNPDAVLDRVGLADAADRNVEALSGGMTRLLGIAQATVGDPPVVVLDEPASGLDPGMRRQTFEVVSERAAAGTAVVLSTHDTALAERFADRVFLLGGGGLLAAGSPSELVEQEDSLQAVFEAEVSREASAVGTMGESP
jgi:ABC-type multidrug transport system ATPase subunit